MLPGTTSFTQSTLGRGGPPVFRLGVSASYRPGEAAVRRAIERGVNVFFCFGFDGQMTRVLRGALGRDRERFVVVTGAYNYVWWRQNPRRALESRLRALRTDYIDVFLFLGVMKASEFTAGVRAELLTLREEGRVRRVGVSTHDRPFAGRLAAEGAAEGAMDTLMVRYNAAHRGAERDIFPHLDPHRPGIIAYTATRWTALLRPPKGWPPDQSPPDAGQCYRFVLSHPAVDVCLTAPRSVRELDANLDALARGPLDPDEMAYLRNFGDAVRGQRRWFM
ncbi:MAG: aldo/keto reductase [Bryobacterales bacterium]|nr:aldo/keto reductase [Bryobacterales bacterium]